MKKILAFCFMASFTLSIGAQAAYYLAARCSVKSCTGFGELNNARVELLCSAGQQLDVFTYSDSDEPNSNKALYALNDVGTVDLLGNVAIDEATFKENKNSLVLTPKDQSASKITIKKGYRTSSNFKYYAPLGSRTSGVQFALECQTE